MSTALGAIVLDCNSLGRGRLDLEALRQIARLAEDKEIEVWVPEPVLWEWVEHAAATYVNVQRLVDKARGELVKAGIDIPSMPAENMDALCTHLAEEVAAAGPSVRVLSCTAEAAVAGLRDQILQLPPAKRKGGGPGGGVKTGASDSTWLRMVHLEADRRGVTYAIVSADGDITTGLDAWNPVPRPRVLASIGELRRFLSRYLPSADAIPMCLSYLGRMAAYNDWRAHLQLGPLLKDDSILTALTRSAGARDDAVIDVDLSRPRVAGLTRVEMSDEADSILATVFLIGTLTATAWAREDETASWRSDQLTLDDVVVRADLIFDLEAGQIVAARSEQENSTAFILPSHFGSAGDAYRATLGALQAVPEVSTAISKETFAEHVPFEMRKDANMNYI